MDSTTTSPMLLDSTRQTNGRGGSVCTTGDERSDLSSDMSTSTSGGLGHGSLTDYQLDRLLGRGKYSQVYLAREKTTGQMVAIKRVEIFDMMDPASRQACVKEVKILQNVEHPNIVKCFRSFLADNELVIVLEWAEAGDLGQLIKARSDAGQVFSTEEVWVQFQQVCNALRHMHERRMMHRDLKPSNIFVTCTGDLKLGDLGLSRYFSSRTLQAQTTVGTPYYMSPEVVRGQPYDFSSDIWSLGCLLYELVALRNPFYKENQSLYVLGKNIQNCQYEPLPDTVPDEVRQLVTNMLQPQPASRPTIGQVAEYVNGYMAQHYPQYAQHAAATQQPPAAAAAAPIGVGAPPPSAGGSRSGTAGGSGSGSRPGSVAGGPAPMDMGLGVTGFGIQLAGRGVNSQLPR